MFHKGEIMLGRLMFGIILTLGLGGGVSMIGCPGGVVQKDIPVGKYRLTVNSDRPGLRTYLDGVYVGMTPLDTYVPAKAYMYLNFAKVNGEPIDQELSPQPQDSRIIFDEVYPVYPPDQEVSHSAPALSKTCSGSTVNPPGEAELRVESTPPGAEVVVAGEVLGQTPLDTHVTGSDLPQTLQVIYMGRVLFGSLVYLTSGSMIYYTNK